MKIVHRNMKEGAIIVVPESMDDLWHLEKIIAKEDLVSGTTFRHIKIKGTGEKTESRPVYIKILVNDVSFQEHSDKLRVKGVIKEAKPEELIDMGSHHTFEVEPGTKIKIIKVKWKQHELDRLKKAEADAQKVSVSLVVIDDESASFGHLKQYKLETTGTIRSEKSGKQYGKTNYQEKYFSEVLEKLNRIESDKIIIAGPGFTAENLQNWLKEKKSPVLKKCFFGKTSVTGKVGLEEIIRRGLIEKIVEESELNEHNKLMDEVLARISKEGNVAYGLKEIENAASNGAVEELLVTDKLFLAKRKELEKLFDTVDKNKGKIRLIHEEEDAGKKLKGLGGIAALLRFKV